MARLKVERLRNDLGPKCIAKHARLTNGVNRNRYLIAIRLHLQGA